MNQCRSFDSHVLGDAGRVDGGASAGSSTLLQLGLLTLWVAHRLVDAQNSHGSLDKRKTSVAAARAFYLIKVGSQTKSS